MSTQVGELALRVWDLLAEAYRRRDGSQSATDLMAMSDLGRAEITFGLRELAQGGWIMRVVAERDGRMVEAWTCVERHPRRRHLETEAAE